MCYSEINEMYKRVSTNNNSNNREIEKEMTSIIDDDNGNDSENVSENVSEHASSAPVSNKYKNMLYKVSNVIKRLKPSICRGLSNSWFISSCVGIYLKYFLIYKCSKKTPENYNYMIKGITTKLAEKNIFFIKIFQAFANNNNVMDKELFNYFIQSNK